MDHQESIPQMGKRHCCRHNELCSHWKLCLHQTLYEELPDNQSLISVCQWHKIFGELQSSMTITIPGTHGFFSHLQAALQNNWSAWIHKNNNHDGSMMVGFPFGLKTHTPTQAYCPTTWILLAQWMHQARAWVEKFSKNRGGLPPFPFHSLLHISTPTTTVPSILLSLSIYFFTHCTSSLLLSFCAALSSPIPTSG